MAGLMRGKRARLGALAAALAAALALAVALGVTQRGDAPGATAQTATATATATAAPTATATPTTTTETPATALPANPPTCTARTLGVSRASNPGLTADCDTLLAIMSTLGVSGWIDYDTPSWWDHSSPLNWSAGSTLRYWRAVTLGGTPLRVTGLDFSDARESTKVYSARQRRFLDAEHYTRQWTLRGVIPTQLGNLTALTTLDLGGSELTGAIPTQLGNLTKLTRLDLSDNMLTGSIPAGLRELPPTLTTLRLAGNSFTGCIDERLRLAETNDLATLMTARGLSWCPVAKMPGKAALSVGTYQIDGNVVIDIPEVSTQVMWSAIEGYDADSGLGLLYCLSDLAEYEEMCLDAHSGAEVGRGAIDKYRRGGGAAVAAAESASGTSAEGTRTPIPGLQELFDKISASARPAP